MDFQHYKDEHPELEKRLDSMEKRAREAEILTDLKEHPGVLRLIEGMRQDIETINLALMQKRISEHERDLLFVQRDCWNSLIGRFDHAERTVVNIKKYLEKL